jgi:hypothetical protein
MRIRPGSVARTPALASTDGSQESGLAGVSNLVSKNEIVANY